MAVRAFDIFDFLPVRLLLGIVSLDFSFQATAMQFIGAPAKHPGAAKG
jgi:hypothetical protein